jgi:4-hydroxy 2-oxovalerate aldolase
MENSLIVLDCTLRDGGYYNKWDFDSGLVNRYLESVSKSNLQVVELGLRGFPQEKFLGAFAYTTDDYIRSLELDENVLVGVMVDAKTLLKSPYTIDEGINILFSHEKDSPVGLVRVAAHFTEVEQCREIVSTLKKLGYKVGFNLMQSGGRSDEELSNKASLIESWKSVDILYFADSLGNMDCKEVVRIIQALKTEWSGELGIHTHNNKGLAIRNTFTAIEHGVTWLDSTMTGMGRGAGNAQTEILLLELNQTYDCGYKVEEVFELVLNDFMPLQKTMGWGANLLYHLAANYDIHPSYIQEMLGDDRYAIEDILKTIEFIKPLNTTSYIEELLHEARVEPTEYSKGSWDAEAWCKGQDVILLGAGPSLVKHKKAIVQYILDNSPKVIALNVLNEFPEELIDMHVASHDSRILVEGSHYAELKKPIVLPLKRIKSSLGSATFNCELKDYGLNISDGVIDIGSTECTLPNTLAAGYAFSIATIGGASNLFLVGFDGYPIDDLKQNEMNTLIRLYNELKTSINIESLTETSYNVKKSSIYAPRI